MTRLDELIADVDKSKFATLGITSEQVREIIKQQPILFAPAYAGMSRMFGETATVHAPDGIHTVQITAVTPGHIKNHLYCITCNGCCAAAVVALITRLAERDDKEVCPKCGQPSPDPKTPSPDEIFRQALNYECDEVPEEEDEPTPFERYGLMGTR